MHHLFVLQKHRYVHLVVLAGVKGITLREGDTVVGLDVAHSKVKMRS